MAVWIVLTKGNVRENMSLNRLNGGIAMRGSAENVRALASDSGRHFVLLASVHCISGLVLG